MKSVKSIAPPMRSVLSKVLGRLHRNSLQRDRMRRLGSSSLHALEPGHIDTLELLDLIPREDVHTVFDVGANRGTWSVLARLYYPLAEIHAFEPLPQCQTMFRERTHRYS